MSNRLVKPPAHPETKSVTILIPVPLLRELNARASREYRSLSSQVVKILADWSEVEENGAAKK